MTSFLPGYSTTGAQPVFPELICRATSGKNSVASRKNEQSRRRFGAHAPAAVSASALASPLISRLGSRRAAWRNFAEVKQAFGRVDACGRCVIFDIGGNKFRLIAAIHYNTQRIYVRHVLTHVEYDRGLWRSECE